MLRMRFCARSLFMSLTIAALVAGAPAFAADDPAASETKPGDAAGPQTQAPKDKPDEQAPKTPEQARADLYARLAVAKDADETAGIITLLLHAYAESGTDTGDLLLQRARKAISAEEYPDALKILDATIALLPDWAEGWNARATARYLDEDYNGSMADIAQTLKRESQHLGALMGMAAILEARGKKEDALKVYERALAIAPHWRNAQEAADKLKAALAGEEL
jgi:tetratricopeptide (TPR) repeat protein